jgi:23S rRNA (guanine745-N1)-methyltransferase
MAQCDGVLICPVCDARLAQVTQALAQRGAALRCAQGHSFDMAREGYVNLLLSAGKRPKIQGDTRDMVAARRRFLEAGLYEPLAAAVNRLATAHLPDNPPGSETAVVVDVGCGEGYYLGRLQAQLQRRWSGHAVCAVGVDVAKTAVRLAARRYPAAQFVVADTNRQIPVADGAALVALNLFAPRNGPEFGRIIAPGGLLIVVIPTPAHLATLRETFGFLGIEAEKAQRVAAQLAGHFSLRQTQPLAYPLHLSGERLQDLAQMTPTAWHYSAEQWARLAAIPTFMTEASFVILVWQRLTTPE